MVCAERSLPSSGIVGIRCDVRFTPPARNPFLRGVPGSVSAKARQHAATVHSPDDLPRSGRMSDRTASVRDVSTNVKLECMRFSRTERDTSVAVAARLDVSIY